MFAFLKRFRRKKPVAKPVESLKGIKFDPPPMPVTRPPRSASVGTPTIAQPARAMAEHRVESSIAYETTVYFPTPLYVPIDSPTVEVYTPPADPSSSFCSDSSSSSYSAPDASSSYDCSSSSIDYGSSSPSSSDGW